MALDAVFLSALCSELSKTLVGAKIDKVQQPERDQLLLSVRSRTFGNSKLLLSAGSGSARVHLTNQKYEQPQEPPMFCMLMRKHLQGGHITEIAQLEGDRVLKITLENKDEMGDIAPRELYLELMGRHSNLTLVMNGRIVDAIRHVSYDMSRVRQALPGLPFVMPPQQDKLNPRTMTEKELSERLTSCQGRLDKAISHTCYHHTTHLVHIAGQPKTEQHHQGDEYE